MDAPFALLGINDVTGKSPETRLNDGDAARRLLWAMLQEDQLRSMQRALTKGQVDGNPPYNDARRKAEGRGWECNLNFMEGQAIMDSSAVPYYALFAGVDYFADTRTMFQQDNPQHDVWCTAISNRFSNMLKRWPQFNWHVQQISYWMRLHGIGFALFDKDGDWRFRAVETGCVLAPKQSASCIDDRLPYLFIRVSYRVHELWEKIKDPEAASAAGWDVEAVRNAIKYGMKGLAPSGVYWLAQPWEYYERILKNNDLTASYTDADIVYCCIALVQEFAKPDKKAKISKFIFTEAAVVGDNAPKKDDKHILYSDPNCYDRFQQAIVAFFNDTGDGTWHSVRGLAMKAFKHLEVSNRLKCQTVNRGFIDSSLIIQSESQRNTEKVSMTVWGSVIRVPAGGKITPTSVAGGTAGVMEVDRMITGHLANNIGMFNQRSLSRDDGKGEQPTATQVTQQVAKESTLSQGQITLFYQYLDSLYTEIFARASDPTTSDEEAKRFQQECIDDGVPKEALRDMEYVRANRQSGYGSPQMGLLKQQQMMQLLPMLPEQGKNNWLEDAVTLIEGPEKVKRYVPQTHIPDQDDWQANQENGLIQEGRMPVISTGQHDVIHLTSHLQDAADTLEPVNESIQQGQDDPAALQSAYKYVQIMGQHCEAHLRRLANDPARMQQAKLFQEQLMNLVSFSGKLRSAIKDAIRQQQAQADQQQQATALDALTQAKVNAVQSQAQNATAKTQNQIENQRMKTIHTMGLTGVKTNFDMKVSGIKTAEEIRQGRAKELAMPRELDAKAGK